MIVELCWGRGGYWRVDASGIRWDPCFGCRACDRKRRSRAR